jgi:hypothetical protein
MEEQNIALLLTGMRMTSSQLCAGITEKAHPLHSVLRAQGLGMTEDHFQP